MDITLDNNYIPVIEDGDFASADNLQQQQALLLATAQGEWKENPLTGCNIIDYVNDENPEKMIGNIRRQFKADGLVINSITYINGELNIDAERS